MSKYRIVQVAPLHHAGAYDVQEYKEVSEIDSNQDAYKVYFGLGKTTKVWKWVKCEEGNVFLNDGNFNSYHDAYSYIKRQQLYLVETAIKKDEMDKWNATHGNYQVLREYD